MIFLTDKCKYLSLKFIFLSYKFIPFNGKYLNLLDYKKNYIFFLQKL